MLATGERAVFEAVYRCCSWSTSALIHALWPVLCSVRSAVSPSPLLKA